MLTLLLCTRHMPAARALLLISLPKIGGPASSHTELINFLSIQEMYIITAGWVLEGLPLLR